MYSITLYRYRLLKALSAPVCWAILRRRPYEQSLSDGNLLSRCARPELETSSEQIEAILER